MNLERGFRRITFAVSAAFFLFGGILVVQVTPQAARYDAREAARRIIAARDKDFRESDYTNQTEILDGLLRGSVTPRDEVLGLANAAERAARFAQARAWAIAFASLLLLTCLPWSVFFLLRRVARAFSQQSARKDQ